MATIGISGAEGGAKPAEHLRVGVEMPRRHHRPVEGQQQAVGSCRFTPSTIPSTTSSSTSSATGPAGVAQAMTVGRELEAEPSPPLR